MKRLLSICIFIMFAPLSLWANIWEPLGLQGEEVEELVIDPKNPEVMYATIRVKEHWEEHWWFARDLLKTTDGGRSWEICISAPGTLCIYIDPSDPDVIYAWGLFPDYLPFGKFGKSVDGGKSFTALNPPFDPMHGWISVDPDQPDTLYFEIFHADGVSMFRSRDGGISWEDYTAEWQADIEENMDLSKRRIINPANANTVYNIEENSYIFISYDGGASWEPFMSGIEGVQIWNLVFHPEDPSILYALTDNGIYRTNRSDRLTGVSPARKRSTTWGEIRSAE